MKRPFCLQRWVRRQILRVVEVYDNRRKYNPRRTPACLDALVYALSSDWSHPKLLVLTWNSRAALIERELLWLHRSGHIKYADDAFDGDLPAGLYWTLTSTLERLALA